MTILPNIEEAMEDARNGKLSPYWQNNLKRECLHGELSAEERLALSELNCILSETPQWSSEEELCHDMENISGRVRFCRFWNEHYSMVQLTEDRNGKYSTAYVLDTETTPDVRKVAALQAQKELADCMQAWGVSLLEAPVPEQMKYDSLAEAASHLWGDRIFEKCGIRRDEEGDGGKTLEIRGKRRLSARDGGANYQQS